VTRLLLRAGGALVLAGVLVGPPAAQAGAPHPAAHPVVPAYGHTTNEWLMMGARCGASMTSG
jgi:hypothetical protein